MGHRPSRTWARCTPPSTAWAHASTLGIMPPLAAPVGHHAVQLVHLTWLIRVAGSPGSDRSPATSVRKTSFSASRARGDGPGRGVGVDVERLPGGVGADGRHHRDEALGQQLAHDASGRPRPRRPRTRAALRRAVAVMRWASSPDSPTARAPCTLMVTTMSRLTLPTSTMRARSMVSASVTRKPSWNSASLPTRRHQVRRSGVRRRGPPPAACPPSASARCPRRRRPAAASSTRRRPARPERVAAVLDHHHLAPEAPDVGQGLDQHGRPWPPGRRHRRSAAAVVGRVTRWSGSRRCTRSRGRRP